MLILDYTKGYTYVIIFSSVCPVKLVVRVNANKHTYKYTDILI